MCEIKQVELEEITNPVNIFKDNDKLACFPSSIPTPRAVLTQHKSNCRTVLRREVPNVLITVWE